MNFDSGATAMNCLDLGCPACGTVGRIPATAIDRRYDCRSCGAAFVVHRSGITLVDDPRDRARRATQAACRGAALPVAPRPARTPSRARPSWRSALPSWDASALGGPSWRRPRLAIGAVMLALGLGVVVPALWPRDRGPDLCRVAGVVLCDLASQGRSPLAGGTVCFEPVAAPGFRAEGQVRPDGSFDLNTVPGSVRVSLVTRDHRVPARYGDPDSSGLLVSVEAGRAMLEPIVVVGGRGGGRSSWLLRGR